MRYINLRFTYFYLLIEQLFICTRSKAIHKFGLVTLRSIIISSRDENEYLTIHLPLRYLWHIERGAPSGWLDGPPKVLRRLETLGSAVHEAIII